MTRISKYMKIATWNVNSLKVRLPQVLDWLNQTNCDVLAMQELKMENTNFPEDEFKQLGYHCAFNGQKTYNGVAIVSKQPITDVIMDMPKFADHQKRVITATIDGIRIICVYVVNGESIDSEKFVYKLGYLQELKNFTQEQLALHKNLVVLGDFNIAPADIDVHDPQKWYEQVLCSNVERQWFNQFIDLGLSDSFRIFNQEANQYSWWDYRSFAFRRKMGLRIDHILISKKLQTNVTACSIDINPRKNERPSDHTPVILELNL